MAQTKYTYSISANTLNNKVDAVALKLEYENSSITTALDYINVLGNDLDIFTKDALSTQDKTTLDSVIANHSGESILPPDLEIDDDGRQINKTATTYKGWRYIAHPIEVETSKLNGIFEQDWAGTDRGFCSVKFYDSTDTELVAGTQTELDSNCVKTVITFAPSYDIDIIGGNLHQFTTPTDDIRLWVIAGATDLKHLPDTVKEFVGGLNFRYITPGNKIETDGRASARLNLSTTGVPVPTNKMQYIITHPTGHKHKLMIVVEYFRE